MILKYNKFKFTSLINEAIMQYDKDFLTIISDIKFKTKNNIADVILSTSNRDIDNKDNKELLNRMPETTSRPSWRQMQ